MCPYPDVDGDKAINKIRIFSQNKVPDQCDLIDVLQHIDEFAHDFKSYRRLHILVHGHTHCECPPGRPHVIQTAYKLQTMHIERAQLLMAIGGHLPQEGIEFIHTSHMTDFGCIEEYMHRLHKDDAVVVLTDQWDCYKRLQPSKTNPLTYTALIITLIHRHMYNRPEHNLEVGIRLLRAAAAFRIGAPHLTLSTSQTSCLQRCRSWSALVDLPASPESISPSQNADTYDDVLQADQIQMDRRMISTARQRSKSGSPMGGLQAYALPKPPVPSSHMLNMIGCARSDIGYTIDPYYPLD